MQRTRVFWLGVPTSVLVVGKTATCPHVGVCALFSFAKTELLVLVFRKLNFRKYDTFFQVFLSIFFHLHGIFLHIIIAFNIAAPMDPSTSMSAENREVEQLRAFIDETATEVAEAINKFCHQEDLVDTFKGDATAMGYAAAIV